MEQVKNANFPHVNMDLIAGLPEDTPEGFARSLDEVISMGADNITVHTLSLKKGSRISSKAAASPARTSRAKCWTMPTPRCVNMVLPPIISTARSTCPAALKTSAGRSPAARGSTTSTSWKSCTPSFARRGRLDQDGRRRQIRRAFNAKYPREYIDRPEKRRANLMDFARFYAEQGE